MDANPVLKPKLATPALVLISVAVSACTTYLLGTMAITWPPDSFVLMASLAALMAASVAGAVWLARMRRHRVWTAAANKKWNYLEDMKRTHGTTTEVTVLSVDALEPTGSWISINWNQFDYVQRAWIEALHDPIWPGTVLLISPDPAQVAPGAPWPATYYIRAADFVAWAPVHQS